MPGASHQIVSFEHHRCSIRKVVIAVSLLIIIVGIVQRVLLVIIHIIMSTALLCLTVFQYYLLINFINKLDLLPLPFGDSPAVGVFPNAPLLLPLF